MVAPIIEELAKNTKVKLRFIKYRTRARIVGCFCIRSIPSLLFIPTSGQPQMAQGALPKNSFKDAIKDVFGGQ